MAKYLNRNYSEIYGFLVSLLFISLPFPSPVITNILLGVLSGLVIYFQSSQGLQKMQKNQKVVFLLLCLFVFSLIIPSSFYETDYLNNKVTRPLYFLAIPLLFFMGGGLNLKNIETIKKYFILAVVLFSFIGFLKMLYLYYMQIENKLFFDAFARSLKIHTTSFAYLTVLAFSFTFKKLLDRKGTRKRDLLYLVLSLYLLALLFFIATRIAFLAVILLMVVLLVTQYRKEHYKRSLVYAASILLLLIFFSFNGYLSQRFENVYKANIENKSDVENRLIIWQCAIDVYKDNPHKFFGLGITNSNDLLRDCYYQKDFFGKDLGYHAHNQYLQTLIAGGIIGIMVLMILMLYIFIHAIKTRNLFLFISMLIFSIFFITESVFEQQIGVTTFTLFVSLFLCHNPKNLK